MKWIQISDLALVTLNSLEVPMVEENLLLFYYGLFEAL